MLLAFNGCSGQSTSFVFSPGSHYPKPKLVKMHTGVASMERTVLFDLSCVYELGNEDDFDINKLFGWSVGFTNRHSIRIGWNCVSDSGIDLYAYMHFNGKRWNIPRDSSSNRRRPDLIGRGFLPNYTITLRISRARDAITFEAIQLSRRERLVVRFRDFPTGSGWFMYPYFGGTSTAPQKMSIVFY